MFAFRLLKFNVIKSKQNLILIALKRFYTNDLTGPLEEHRIIPELLWKAPCDILKVKYKGEKCVKMGNKLSPEETKDQPVCIQWDGNKKCYYTIYMGDLDQPSRESPKEREWQHWLIGNIPGNNLRLGISLTPYLGPLPKADSGCHRCVFLLFKQKKCQDFDEPILSSRSLMGRSHFSIRDFKVKYCLDDAIATNFFITQNDCYASEKLDQLKKADREE